MPKPQQTKHAYNIPRLNKVFAVSSGLLLLSFLLVIWQDWHWTSLPLLGTQADRQWKRYQIQFNDLERAKAQQDKADAELRAELRGLRDLEARTQQAQQALAERAQDLRQAEDELRQAAIQLSFASRNFADAKALLDQRRSEYELELEHRGLNLDAPSVRQAAQVLRAQQQRADKLALDLEAAEQRQKQAEEKRVELVKQVNQLNREVERLRGEIDTLQKKIRRLSDPVAQKALAAPIIEFLASPLQPKQIILENHQKTVNFARVPTVDRCITCHLGADKSQTFFTVETLEGVGEKTVEFTPANLRPLLELASKRSLHTSSASPPADTHAAASSSASLRQISFDDIRRFLADAAQKKTIPELAARRHPVLTRSEFEQLVSVLGQEGVAVRHFYESLPQPLKSHPKLDLFVGADSPHPMEKFGCSVCHHGSDRDLDFSYAGHTPDRHSPRTFLRDEAHGRWLEAGSYVPNAADVKEVRQMTQQQAWVKNYQWRHDHFNEWPMRPRPFIEASCLKCHTGQTEVAQAPKLNRGLRLIEQLGCWACHKMKQLETYATHRVAPGETLAAVAKSYDVNTEDISTLNQLANGELKPGREILIPIRTLNRPGPNLKKIAAKSNPDWVRKWLENPAAFRPDTLMPRFWGHGGNGPDSVYTDPYLKDSNGNALVIKASDRNNAEIAAITEYLFALSEKPAKTQAPEGDRLRGRQLVSQLGCLGCHMVGDPSREEPAKLLKPPVKPEPSGDDEKDEEAQDKYAQELADYKRAESQMQLRNQALAQTIHDVPEQFRRWRSHGPMLAGTGSKTDRDWLFAWLKNPRSYHPKTRMPNLRLSDEEAADIATYLASLRHQPTDEQRLESPDPNVVRSLTLEYLETTFTRAEAQKRFERGQYDDLIYDYFAPEAVVQYLKNPALAQRRAAELQDAEKRARHQEEKAKAAGDDALAAQAQQALQTTLRQLHEHEALTAEAAQTRARLDAMSADQKRAIYLGGKLIARYGCFACHEIKGFEKAKPIGVELSDWGSKEIAKLDFGLLGPDRLPRDRYAYVLQKLADPRIFDEGKYSVQQGVDASGRPKLSVATKSPQEWLKMPLFNLSEADREAIATVVTGMTNEPMTPNEARQLSKQEFDIERGRWLAKELNCAGCHLIEGKGWAIRTAGVPASAFDGHFRWQDIAKQGVIGEGLEPPMLSGTTGQLKQGARTQPDWLFSFLKAPTTGLIRPWLKARMPTFDLSDAEANVLVRYFAYEAKEQYPYKTPPPRPSAKLLAAGKQFFENLQCGKCHIVEGKAFNKPLSALSAEQLTQLAPDFRLAHQRLQRDFLLEQWLPNPGALVPGTRMPVFEYGPPLKDSAPPLLGSDRRKQLEALVDYLMSLGDPANQPPTDK